jgi:prepilin-type N-terminal cleavage/methylation domain-containing protein
MARAVLKKGGFILIMRVKTGVSAMRPMGKNPSCRRDQQPNLKAAFGWRFRSRRQSAGYSLIEVVVASAIMALVYGSILTCYIQCGLRAQWAGYSLAAQSLATEQIEQARSAIWDPAMGFNQATQLNLSGWTYNSGTKTWSGYVTSILDVPYATTNFTVATNYVSVQLITISTIPPVQVQMIQVDTVWPFRYRAGNLYFTNTAATLLAPDNRDPQTL